MALAHYDTFRVQLANTHSAFGHALWEPDPGEDFPPVEVGDVGFIRQGNFHRLFNALLPEDHPSHDTFGVPENHDLLQPSTSNHINRGTLHPNNFCSYGVNVSSGESNFNASEPPAAGSAEVSISCRRQQGAVLSLPVAARREDTFAQAHFRTWILTHIDSWFNFAHRHGLGIAMEDIVLVTGCHRTRSWTNIAFYEGRAGARVSFGVQVPGIHGTTVHWRVSSQHVQGAVLSHGPSGENLPDSQCIFIRGFRVKRTFKLFPRVRGAAEPIPDSSGKDDEQETEVVSIAGVPEFRDPLHVLLDYLAEREPNCDLALVHDDDLERILRVGNGTSLETLQAAEVMNYLQSSKLEIGVAVIPDPFSTNYERSRTDVNYMKVAMLSEQLKDFAYPSKITSTKLPALGFTLGDEAASQTDETIPDKIVYLMEDTTAIKNGELADVDAAVARSRKSRQSSHQKTDLDKAITHSTEAVLLPPTYDTVLAFYHLALLLLSRYTEYNQPDDIKYSVKYFRFLRNNFHSLEAFNVPYTSGDLPSKLLCALAHNSLLTPGDMERDFEEIVALIPEFVTADALTIDQKEALYVFHEVLTQFVKTMFLREDTQKVANRAIQVLREATELNQDSAISFALAICLSARFETTYVMNDYEEAIGAADRIIATCSPGNNPNVMERKAMLLIALLLMSRLKLSSRPDYLLDAICRIRTFIPCLPDEYRTRLAEDLVLLVKRRHSYFGVTGNSDGIPIPGNNPHFDVRTEFPFGSKALPRTNEIIFHLMEVTIAIKNGEITDVDGTVERSRKLLPLQQSSDQWSSSSEITRMFAELLFGAYQFTKRSNYLDEAITTFRYLHNMSAAKGTWVHFNSGWTFWKALIARLQLFPDQEDFEELMQLSPKLANDDSEEMFRRVKISFFWAGLARVNMHRSVPIAYETAMSLLQDALVFSPTLQTQHLRLSQAFKQGERLPSGSDYASYLIQNGQVKQAVETLEQGRTLIWSEMRGLRTSTDQLRAADPALADKLADINQRLDSMAMSFVQSEDERGRGETETGSREYSIGHLVLTQRRLLVERNSLVSHIQSLPGFEHFLKPPSFDFLNCVTSHGPVIIVNQAHADSDVPKVFKLEFQVPSYIILLLKDSRPFVISTPSNFHDRANQLENDLSRVRKEKGPDSEDYDRTLASVLADLYELVGKCVIERLRKFKVPEKSRVWWYPTGAFCSLPLHAMGPIPSDDGKKRYFSDLYIPSYTSSLSALIESPKRGSLSDVSDNLKPSILLVAQPDTLPGAVDEINTILLSTKTPVTTLISAMATPKTVIEGLRGHRFAHFMCHGLLEAGKPFDAALELHGDNLSLLNIGSQLPTAEFAFLSACHTAELTEGGLIDERLHLVAAMQYCGFRSVVGTMWAMADMDGADLSKHFYKAIFVDKADQNGVSYHERSARALQTAVKRLRKKRGMTLERWVNFVHYGA